MKLLLLPGDGIGPEVAAQARRVLAAVCPQIAVDEALFGGAAIDAAGHPLPPETLAAALSSDAVLMGAVGGPQWSNQPFGTRPEAGIIALRAAMGVFANIRPAKLFPALLDASALRPERVRGLDLVIVRELTGGIYFGEPRGIETLDGEAGRAGDRRGFNTQSYTSAEIRRVARVGFELARGRRCQLCSVEKSNVMESGLLWRQEVSALAGEYPDVTLSHMLADACAMELVRAPTRFDVIVTDNLFGDILSDEAAMLTGSLGLLPSAALGEAGRPGLFEPIHGSAPDIAGQGIANPCAAILSLAMALRLSLGQADTADAVERAVERALDDGHRTRDVGGTLGTVSMGDAVLAALRAG